MLIECHSCNGKVDAEILGQHKDKDFFDKWTYLLRCPSCNKALVAESHEDMALIGEESGWTQPIRVYPLPVRSLGGDIPNIVRLSMDEAERCMQAGAQFAATAMCGRALEAICRHCGTQDAYLGVGLKELRDKGVIDARLFMWSEELRNQRNNAAHATEAVITAEDARDLMTFTYAIVDYVFLLSKKFEDFQQRKMDQKSGLRIPSPKA
jgi:hypothetical protein